MNDECENTSTVVLNEYMSDNFIDFDSPEDLKNVIKILHDLMYNN